MLLAAYMVAGFIVAGVYAAGLLRGRRDRYHRLGLRRSPSPSPRSRRRCRSSSATSRRGRCSSTSRPSSPRSRCCRAPARTCRRRSAGSWWTASPATASTSRPAPRCCPGSARRRSIRGLDAIPPQYRPPDRLVTIVHLAFDVMVGIGFALLALVPLVRDRLVAAAGRSGEPLAAAVQSRSAASLALVALWCGWVVTEVGRQPWTVVGLLLTRDAVTTAGNLWLFFAAPSCSTSRSGPATFAVLRLLRRRWAAGRGRRGRRRGRALRAVEGAGPRRRDGRRRRPMSTVAAVLLFVGVHRLRRPRRCRLRGGVLGPDRRRRGGWPASASPRRRHARARSGRPTTSG